MEVCVSCFEAPDLNYILFCRGSPDDRLWHLWQHSLNYNWARISYRISTNLCMLYSDVADVTSNSVFLKEA